MQSTFIAAEQLAQDRQLPHQPRAAPGPRYATGPEDSVWVCRLCEAILDDSDAPCPHCHDADDDDSELEDWS